MKTVHVVDYGRGNLGSLKRAFEEVGSRVVITSSSDEISHADILVLPGVGSFRDGIESLHAANLIGAIKKHHENKKPLLGICLGMQLLATHGMEGGKTDGLNLISGSVIPFQPSATEKVPHVGWNSLQYNSNEASRLFNHVPNLSDVYFVHSFHFVPSNSNSILCSTPYNGTFISGVIQENTIGLQFHPEKSSKVGIQIIKNFVEEFC